MDACCCLSLIGIYRRLKKYTLWTQVLLSLVDLSCLSVEVVVVDGFRDHTARWCVGWLACDLTVEVVQVWTFIFHSRGLPAWIPW